MYRQRRLPGRRMVPRRQHRVAAFWRVLRLVQSARGTSPYDATIRSLGLLVLRDLLYGARPLVLAAAIRGKVGQSWLDTSQRGAAARRVAGELT